MADDSANKTMTADECCRVVCEGVPSLNLPMKAGVVMTAGSTLRGVLTELRAGAAFNPLELLALIPVIVDIISEVGPQIAEVVKRIREIFGK